MNEEARPVNGNSFLPHDLEMFARFRIPQELIAAARVERVTDQEARDRYGITNSGDMAGLVLPYFPLGDGHRCTARLRRDHSEVEDGKPRDKYITPFGDNRHLYFPPGAGELLAHPATPVILVESEKSALALTAWAARLRRPLVAVATGGCWGWRGRIGKLLDASGARVDETGPLPDLGCTEGRITYVLFDTNCATNLKVRQARMALSEVLRKKKTDVRLVDLPTGDGINGPDDFLAVRGDEALRDLLDGPVITVESSVRNEIRSIVLFPSRGDDAVPDFDKKRLITAALQRELAQLGEFLRTVDRRGFYFLRDERRVLDLEQTPFQHTLTQISGLSATENYFKFARDMLQATTAKTAPLVEIRTFAHFDFNEQRLVVSDGAGGVWARERGSTWREGANGQNGIFFLTDPEAEPFQPEFVDDDSYAWYWRQFLFSDQDLPAPAARLLLEVFLLQQFFPPLRQTRITPAVLGPQGSGKTTGVRFFGRLLLGRRFEVSGIQRDREDDFRAAITNRVVLGCDNADSRISWLPDALALYATGMVFRLRKLYVTNEEVSFPARAILLLSSRDPHFKRPDVAERLLPLYFERPKAYLPEHVLFDELAARRNRIIGAILRRVAAIADSLDLNKKAKLVRFRMADYATFGLRVVGTDRQQSWLSLLNRVEKLQAEFTTEDDGTVIALGILLKRDGEIAEMTTGELFKKLKVIAERSNLPFARTAPGFGKHLTAMKRAAEIALGATIRFGSPGGRVKTVNIKPSRNCSA